MPCSYMGAVRCVRGDDHAVLAVVEEESDPAVDGPPVAAAPRLVSRREERHRREADDPRVLPHGRDPAPVVELRPVEVLEPAVHGARDRGAT